MGRPSATDESAAANRFDVRVGTALLVVHAVLVFGFYRVLGSNELTTLPIARHWIDPAVYPNDWFYDAPPLPRLPFAILVAPLTQLAPLSVVALGLRLVGWTLLAWTLARLFRRIELPVAAWVPVLGLFFGLGQSLFAGEWLFKHAESKVLAYAAVFFALDRMLARRWLAAGLSSGVAVSAHALVGGWSALASLAALVRSRRWLAPRWTLGFLGLSAGASVGAYVAARVLVEPALADPAWDPLWIYVHFRNPHHLDPASFDWNAVRIVGSVFFFGVLAAAARFARTPARRFVATFAFAAFAIAAAGLLSALVPGGERVLRFYPFRVGPSAGLLLALALATAEVVDRVAAKAPSAPRFAWVVTAAVMLAAVPRFSHQLRVFLEFPSGAMIGSPEVTEPHYDATRWIREHTAPDAVVLASPRYIETAVLSERSMVVTFKGVPAGKRNLVEWYRRIVAFNGGVEPEQRGFRAPEEVDATFDRLDAASYRGLARAFGADLLLVRRRPGLPLPELYANRRWGVYALTATTAAGVPAKAATRGLRSPERRRRRLDRLR